MALYGGLLEALESVYGQDAMIKMYNAGVELGINTKAGWNNYYTQLAEKTPNLIEWVTKSGKSTGLWSVQETTSVATATTEITGTTELATVNTAFGTDVAVYEGTELVELSTVGGSAGSTTVGSFVVGEVLPAVAGAMAGVVLGVAVDKVLYESNPDYWDEKLPTLNPETWDDIVLGHDTKIPLLHNTADGKTYISEDMLAYTSLVGNANGWFNDLGEYDDISSEDFSGYSCATFNSFYGAISMQTGGGGHSSTQYSTVSVASGNGKFSTCYTTPTDPRYLYDGVGNQYINFTWNGETLVGIVDKDHVSTQFQYSYNDKRSYAMNLYDIPVYKGQEYIGKFDIGAVDRSKLPLCTGANANIICWVGVYGDEITHHEEKVDGITITGAVPDMSGVTNMASAKLKLRDTYPDLYDNAINVPSYDPSTDTVTNNTWIPASVPTNFVNNDGDVDNNPSNKPTSDNLNQTNDGSYPDDETEQKAKENEITQGITPTPPDNIDPVNPILPSEDTPAIALPETPVDTGLGAVYVPTIGELRSFSEWLWSPNFIDQIKKLFSDPMQGIIGLHQVYFTPSHDGTDTIHCGYLDSNVNSDYTKTRYYTIDCGTIDIKETFGNVFDYDPLTTIDLYLPFIGIVPLKVGDVMRSQLNVTYNCDVLTGACLCNVNVIRDGATCMLYTYGGNCAVNYPLSSGSYMGIVSALAGVGLSVATAVGTGGMSIPLSLAGGVTSMLNAHTNVKTSGGYGGNTGAMGIKTPYVIIKNTLSSMPKSYNKYTGNPYNNTNKLNNCTGFTQANVIHLVGDMTQDEKNEINNLLSTGVII